LIPIDFGAMPQTSPLSKQVILITGASAGIGAGLAKFLADRYLGIRLVLAARNVEKLAHVAELCSKAGAEVLIVPTDIINVSSLAGKIAFPFGGLYSASKFALEAVSDSLRRELTPFNIRVSVIEPGPVSTEFFDVVDKEIDRTIHDPEHSPYRVAFKKLEGLEKQTSSRAWTSEQVAVVILKAMTARNPRPRYVAATSGDFLLFMMTKVLPTSLVDQFWQRFYGIDLVAKDWQTRKDK
jgi:short-subunit dehydrogenase